VRLLRAWSLRIKPMRMPISSSHILSDCSTGCAAARLRSCTSSKCVRSSVADPNAMRRHRTNCGVVARAYPSAMFAGMAAAARRIWSARPKCRRSGSSRVSLYAERATVFPHVHAFSDASLFTGENLNATAPMLGTRIARLEAIHCVTLPPSHLPLPLISRSVFSRTRQPDPAPSGAGRWRRRTTAAHSDRPRTRRPAPGRHRWW